MNIHSSDRMYHCQYCIKIFGSKKEFEKHVSDMHISHFSSSESNAITSKKGEEYHSRELVVHTGNHQICNDDVRNIWERFVNLMSTDSLSFPIFFSVQPFSYKSL